MLASFFLPSHLSLKHVYIYTCTCSYSKNIRSITGSTPKPMPVNMYMLASFFLPSHLSFKNMYMFLMRDEKEERKKQARSNKQTRQSNTAHPRQSLFLEKMSCLRWDSNPRHSILQTERSTCTRFGVWCHWWFHYPGLLLHTELMVSLFIRCTMRCEILAQPAELPR